MAWIWSDELAEAAESAGLEHREIAAWRRRPVAFALGSNERAESLARQLLGLTVDEAPAGAAGDLGETRACACSVSEVLARSVDAG